MTIGHDDATPTDNTSTLELILQSCTRTEKEARDTKLYAERSHDISLKMFEEHKTLQTEVEKLKTRAWTPAVVSVLAALFCLACVFAAAQP